ncbi:PREDICTED: uncharacterized protein LOC105363636 [Ceratosolen solmsi marchali]|uniref:Uncharacterized protein LOC105363636 n=1 Tax=Ceratosolen solmsi marchali TaxID=326594 RepID=A0AAJ6YKC2_9HYME|nr:PREDICTED: uncharacterized protein LOC105363636 [Ceratosolen solmsi marchali]
MDDGSTAEWSGPSRSARDHQEARCHRCACEDTATNYGGWLFEDEPPPYASLVEPERHHPGWPYVLPGRPYEDAGEPRSIARPLVSIPLTSYGIFKIEPPRYPAASAVGRTTPLQMPQHPRLLVEAGPVVKSSTGTARKYGAILIAATVIIFLMALSLMVRFVTEKSLWRG